VGDIFKNKFFIILLIVICVLTLSTIILNLTGHGSVVTDIVNVILTPFQRFAVILKDSFSGFVGYFTEFNRMKDEIEELKEKLEAAEILNEDTFKMAEKIETYEAFYGFQSKHTNYDLYPARVTARDPGNYLSSLTIDKGSFYGIAKDMPVVAAKKTDGDKYIYMIVGYVSEAGTLSAKVVPYIYPGTAIGAYIERTGETGIVEGDFKLAKNGMCRIAYLSKETVLEIGDKIYSSGNGGIYPEDLYIGEITEIVPDPSSHTMIGYIKPAVDFNELKDIMVILEFTRNFY